MAAIPPEAAVPLLELEHISLSFKGVKAISDISFAVGSGEICALIGPNGAGKSSLLNVINGVYHPQQGVLRFRGAVRRRQSPTRSAHDGIARTFQNIALFRGMSVLDNLLTGRNLKCHVGLLAQALFWGPARREAIVQREKVEDIIEQLDLAAVRNTAVGQLPYGLQKRVELGRALAAEPQLLLLDEPMAGMNLDEKREMSRHILEARRRGTTVLLIEHDLGVVMDLSDHVVVLDYGRKVGDGTPAQVRNDPQVIAAYIGNAA